MKLDLPDKYKFSGKYHDWFLKKALFTIQSK